MANGLRAGWGWDEADCDQVSGRGPRGRFSVEIARENGRGWAGNGLGSFLGGTRGRANYNEGMPASQFLSSLRRESILAFFEASPTARLLRSDSAPWVVDFLYQTFKAEEVIAIGQAELRMLLAVYQEEIHEHFPGHFKNSPERYLNQWTEAGWLQRFLEATSAEPQYQLTPAAESAIRFVDTAVSQSQRLVGTEGRLRLVIETLEDLVRGASADPDRRLEYLRQQRAAIEEEIAALEGGRSVETYRPAQIRERFETAVDMLKDLQSDFRAVEARFQAIVREVQQLQASGQATRGGILGYALDAEELLKSCDEGISFYAFVAFLLSPVQQSSLRKTIEELQELEVLADQSESMVRVRRMIPALLAEADKVTRTTARLSTTLRRVLDARSTRDRVRLTAVLQDIRQLANQLGEFSSGRMPELIVDAELDLGSSFARAFWSPAPIFDQGLVLEHPMDTLQAKQVATAFARWQRLDLKRLRERIREATLRRSQVSIAQVVADYPLQSGIIELLGYLQIAHDDGHRIEPAQTETIEILLASHAETVRCSIPYVTFTPRAAQPMGARKPR